MVYDADGPLRRVVPFVRVSPHDAAGRGYTPETELVVPSLPLAAMMMADGLDAGAVGVRDGALRIGATRVCRWSPSWCPTTTVRPAPACRALLPWRGPMRRADGAPTFPSYSFYNLFYSQQQVLEKRDAPRLPPDTFRGKIVVVGVAAEGLRDVFVTPFAEGRMPGAEVHANTIDAWRAEPRAGAARGVARRARGHRAGHAGRLEPARLPRRGSLAASALVLATGLPVVQPPAVRGRIAGGRSRCR